MQDIEERQNFFIEAGGVDEQNDELLKELEEMEAEVIGEEMMKDDVASGVI